MENRTDTKSFKEFFAENDELPVSDLVRMIVGQQNIALGLTRLVLEHCIEGKASQEDVFRIYDEACDVLKEQNGRDA